MTDARQCPEVDEVWTVAGLSHAVAVLDRIDGWSTGAQERGECRVVERLTACGSTRLQWECRGE